MVFPLGGAVQCIYAGLGTGLVGTSTSFTFFPGQDADKWVYDFQHGGSFITLTEYNNDSHGFEFETNCNNRIRHQVFPSSVTTINGFLQIVFSPVV
jgi:hypothetical protein